MWPFAKSISGITGNTIVAKIVTMTKETTIQTVYLDSEGKPVSYGGGGYNGASFCDKIEYQQKTKYLVYVEDLYENGQKFGKTNIANNAIEDEANKVYDILVNQKGNQTLTETVKTATINI